MNAAGNLAQSIGDGIAGLVGGAVRALGAAIQGLVNALQSLLPGPWFLVIVVAIVVLVAWSVFRR
ncbi:MAG: hypothetical protein HYX54_09220 [Chloroflexi bacterium]|nr:hypothetical protein [Chloroflexota bacterium]